VPGSGARVVGAQILQGDCRDVLRTLPEASVHCCVTSPPYYGLRDYGVAGQIGLEQTPEEYVDQLVAVFREVRRVLRDDGTLWLNIGDSYCGAPKGSLNGQDKSGLTSVSTQLNSPVGIDKSKIPGIKAKDLIGIPWMIAFALRADGWYLRQDIIWAKPNPMPESVTDRCTKSHEYIFMFSKSPRYYYDAAAIAEPLSSSSSIERLSQPTLEQQRGSDRVPGKTNGNMKAVAKQDAQDASATKARIVDRILSGELTTRNKRSVWTVTTKPFKGAHFATFPPDLIEPCILAGCPPRSPAAVRPAWLRSAAGATQC